VVFGGCWSQTQLETLNAEENGFFVSPTYHTSIADLDSTNFQSTLDSNEFALVMFYAPWCGHCKTLKPKFAEAATKVKGKYVLAKVDCTLETAKDLCQEFGVRGYPTLKVCFVSCFCACNIVN
jgi:protein disulfide-isomerase-like protein